MTMQDALNEVTFRALRTYRDEVDQDRINRAYNIVRTGIVIRINEDMWAVKAPSSPTTYIIDTHGCPCPDATNRALVCKHLYAVYLIQWSARLYNERAA